MVIDELYDRVSKRGPLCVGLDLREGYIPVDFKDLPIEEGLFATAKMIIDVTQEKAACYKVQIACYEALGLKGLYAYAKIIKYLRDNGELVIADVKRGDIASTAEEYAKAHFTGDFEADMVTLNPYMGNDAISPYFPYFKDRKKGAFVLVKTSNPSSTDFEDIKDKQDKALYFIVLDAVKNWGNDFIGASGYAAIGAVVGVNHLEQIACVRELASGKIFLLVPGLGVQGAKMENVAMLIGKETGGIVNVSRGIIAAHLGQNGSPKDIIKAKTDAVADGLKNAIKNL